MDGKLFDRRPDGLHATYEAAELVDAAQEVERAMLSLSRVVRASRAELGGPVRVRVRVRVRVTSCRKWPESKFYIDSSDGVANLAEREADVAIRWMPTEPNPTRP